MYGKKQRQCYLGADQTVIGGVEDGYLSVTAESAAQVQAISSFVFGVNGYCGQGDAGSIALTEHLLDQG